MKKIDNQDTKESISDFVCALKQKTPTFQIFISILETTQLPPKLVINMNTKANDGRTWITFKI